MRWIDRLFSREQADRDLDDELTFHIEMEAAANRRLGMGAQEARTTAMKAIGGTAHRAEECRERRKTRWMEDLLQDFSFALRTLRRSPGFSAVAVLSFAGAIAAATVSASALYTILVKPLAFHEPERLSPVAET